MFYFYILKCKDGTLYSGSTNDLKKREATHNSGKGSKYVIAHGGGKIVYHEKFRSWGKALKREAAGKKIIADGKIKSYQIKDYEAIYPFTHPHPFDFAQGALSPVERQTHSDLVGLEKLV